MASSGGGNAAGEEAVEDEGGRSVEDRREGSCEKRYEPESADHYGGRLACRIVSSVTECRMLSPKSWYK